MDVGAEADPLLDDIKPNSTEDEPDPVFDDGLLSLLHQDYTQEQRSDTVEDLRMTLSPH